MHDADVAAESRAYRRVTLRLIPFLFLCYVVAYLDRVNVGFAKLQMLSDLRMSDTAYGIGAGIFFIGYFLFEVPSNLILHRVGARKWIARIMVTWGVLSMLTMFLAGPYTFYLLRFLLGLAEAGLFPGIVLYLTHWYSSSRRARIISLFRTGVAMSGAIGGPLSGYIMSRMAAVSGLVWWQWLFLLEGIPSLVMGAAVFFYLTDRFERLHQYRARRLHGLVSRHDSKCDRRDTASRVRLRAHLHAARLEAGDQRGRHLFPPLPEFLGEPVQDCLGRPLDGCDLGEIGDD